MPISLPGYIAVDLRDPIAGDSYGWEGLEPAAAKKSLVFHHSGSDAAAEDGFSIADYHVNHNGWSGIGYHFVITRADYPGRAGYTAPGAQIQYVGDLNTWRAHVANQNPGRVGICLVGLTPDAEQLKLARKLVDFLIEPNNILPSINYYSQVTVHRLVPQQSTSCPGDDFGNWLPYLQGGDFPAYLMPAPAPAPEPAPIPAPAPAPAPEPQDTRPEWERTWTPMEVAPQVVAVPSADVIDFTTGLTVAHLAGGSDVMDIAGYFAVNGILYVRTKWSAANNKWNGIAKGDLKDKVTEEPPAPTPTADVPVTTPEAPTTPASTEPVDTAGAVDGILHPTPTEPDQSSVYDPTIAADLKEILVGVFLLPLRLVGWLTKIFTKRTSS